MMFCVMMLPLVVKVCQQSVSQCVKLPTASGVDNAASPDWQTPLNGLFHPQREADQLCKNNWKELQKYINEQC